MPPGQSAGRHQAVSLEVGAAPPSHSAGVSDSCGRECHFSCLKLESLVHSCVKHNPKYFETENFDYELGMRQNKEFIVNFIRCDMCHYVPKKIHSFEKCIMQGCNDTISGICLKMLLYRKTKRGERKS